MVSLREALCVLRDCGTLIRAQGLHLQIGTVGGHAQDAQSVSVPQTSLPSLNSYNGRPRRNDFQIQGAA
jgi:hypothetical protein